MDSVTNSVKTLLSDKKMVAAVAIAGLFIAVAIWMYYKYIVPRVNAVYVPNKEYVNSDNRDSADIYFFYTSWCPHCKTAKPEWQKFKEHIDAKGHSSGVKVNFIEVDCEKDHDTADKFNVTGYPTIKMLYKNKIIEYDAKPQQDNLQQFLDESLTP